MAASAVTEYCPKCGSDDAYRETVDVGVGMMVEEQLEVAQAQITELEAKVASLARMNGNVNDDLEDQHRLAKSWSESSARLAAQLAKAQARIAELLRALP